MNNTKKKKKKTRKVNTPNITIYFSTHNFQLIDFFLITQKMSLDTKDKGKVHAAVPNKSADDDLLPW